jgi:hypothetical protein
MKGRNEHVVFRLFIQHIFFTIIFFGYGGVYGGQVNRLPPIQFCTNDVSL